MKNAIKYENGQLIVDWSQMPEHFNYVAADQDGALWAYSMEPAHFKSDEYSPSYWDCAKRDWKSRLILQFSFDIDNAHATLQKRPQE